MEEDIKILKEERDKLYGELECDAYDGDEEMTQHFTAKYNALNNILNRLEQDERVINNATTHLEYYLLGNSRFEDSQEEFSKLLKMLKRD